MTDLEQRAIALADERLSAGYLDIEDWIPFIVALVRNETLDEAARCAEQYAAEAWTDPNAADTRGIMRLQAEDIAAAIRALAGQP